MGDEHRVERVVEHTPAEAECRADQGPLAQLHKSAVLWQADEARDQVDEAVGDDDLIENVASAPVDAQYGGEQGRVDQHNAGDEQVDAHRLRPHPQRRRVRAVDAVLESQPERFDECAVLNE